MKQYRAKVFAVPAILSAFAAAANVTGVYVVADNLVGHANVGTAGVAKRGVGSDSSCQMRMPSDKARILHRASCSWGDSLGVAIREILLPRYCGG